MKKSLLTPTPTNNYRFLLRSIIILFFCSISLVTFAKDSQNPNHTLQFTPPPPPAGDPPTGRLRGGASRGECPIVNTPLTALATVIDRDNNHRNKDNNNLVWGLTTFDRPTLWFYIPYTQESIAKAEFVLQDDREDDVYRSEIALPIEESILGVTLPETAKSLEVDRDYTWYFKVYCSATDRSPLYVRGIVRRIQLPDLIVDQILDRTPQKQLEIYAANGIWYDTITVLAKMRLANPDEPKLTADWVDLLENNGLGELKNIATLFAL